MKKALLPLLFFFMSTYTYSFSAIDVNGKPVYPIATCEDLENIQNMQANYQLTNDIDCHGKEFRPIEEFYGTLSGLNEAENRPYEIRNFRITGGKRDIYYGAMFKQVEGAYIHDLRFSHIVLEHNPNEDMNTNYSYLAVVAGVAIEDSTFENLEFDDITILPNWYGEKIGVVVANIESWEPYRHVSLNNIRIKNVVIDGSEPIPEMDFDKWIYHGFVVGQSTGKVGVSEITLDNIHVENVTYLNALNFGHHVLVGYIGGLIGKAQATRISNSRVENINFGSIDFPLIEKLRSLNEKDIQYNTYIGGAVGFMSDGHISTTQVKSATFYTNDIYGVAGLAGYAAGSNVFEQNAVRGFSISHCAKKHQYNLGGLIAVLSRTNATVLANNYVQGEVDICNTPDLTYQNIGGLIGYIQPNQQVTATTIKNSYAAVSFTDIGNLGGNTWIKGGLIAYDAGTLTSGALWDTTVSQEFYSAGRNVKGIPTEKFSDQSWLQSLGWDFTTIWSLTQGSPYPTLRMESSE